MTTLTAWRVDRLDPQTGLMAGPYSDAVQPFDRVTAAPCDRHPQTPPPAPECVRCGVFGTAEPEGLLSSVPFAFTPRRDMWSMLGGYTWCLSRIRLEDAVHTPEPGTALYARDLAGTWRGSGYTRERIWITVDDPALIEAMTDAYRCPVAYVGHHRLPQDMHTLRRAVGLPPPPCAGCGAQYHHGAACPYRPDTDCPECGRRWLCAADCTAARHRART